MSQPAPLDPLAVYPAFPAGRDALVVAAPAKLNLFLEIHRKRPDGYHDLESLLVAIDLFDTLELCDRATPGISLTCEPPELPTGPENLVVRAAEALRERTGAADRGAIVHLTKRIPSQAGLGGGSSDAAVTLLGLSRIWKLAQTRPELGGIASVVGSDVGFFLTPPAAWCTGRGEIVVPETLGIPLDFVLVCPAVGLPTAAVYRQVKVPAHPVASDAMRNAICRGDREALARAFANRLEEPAFALAPAVGAIRDRLDGLSPWGARLSGSGSAVFALCRDRAEAVGTAERFRRTRPASELESTVFVARTLAP